VTPLLRDKLHWLREKDRITFELCLLVYKAINGLAPSYLQDLCIPVTTVYTRSALRSAAHAWRPCCPSYQATSRQPGILRRWSYGVERLATRHSNCFVFNHIQEPTQDSLIHPILLHNVIFDEYCMLYGALVVTLWACYGALQIVVLLLSLFINDKITFESRPGTG